MTERIRFLDLGAIPAARTQSVYHAVAAEMRADSPDTIVFCRPTTPYVCVGYHQRVDAVLDRASCDRLGLPLLRRKVGGGATLLDSNQFFYQCIVHRRRMPSFFGAIFGELLRAPVQALCALGLDATLDDVNEICVNGKRIAGTGGGLLGEASVVVGNILFDFDYETMAQVWWVPAECCRELAYAAMREHITTLRELGKNIEMTALSQVLADAYARTLNRPLEPGELTPAELDRAAELDLGLQSNEFVSLHTDRSLEPWGPLKIARGVYIRVDQAELDGEMVNGYFWVSDGIIRRASLSPDVWQSVAGELEGVPTGEWRDYLKTCRRPQRA